MVGNLRQNGLGHTASGHHIVYDQRIARVHVAATRLGRKGPSGPDTVDVVGRAALATELERRFGIAVITETRFAMVTLTATRLPFRFGQLSDTSARHVAIAKVLQIAASREQRQRALLPQRIIQ